MTTQIFKVTNRVDDEIFVGASKDMYNRFGKYKDSYKKVGATSKLFKHFEKHGTRVFKVVLLESCECKTPLDIKEKKREYLRLLTPSLNQKLCLNVEEANNYRKQYWEINKEVINAKRRIKTDCDCGRIYSYSERARHLKSPRHVKWQKIYDFIYS